MDAEASPHLGMAHAFDRAALKAIPIPLRHGEPDAVLDIQSVLNMAYERAGYELRVNYKSSPIPLVAPELSDWLRQTCQGTGKS